MCLLYVVCATAVHGWEGLRATRRDVNPHAGVGSRSLGKEESEELTLFTLVGRSFSTFQPF